MDILTVSDLTELMRINNQPAVSIYMPAHRISARETREDALRLKNLLSRAEKELSDLEDYRVDTRDFLDQAKRLIDDEAFWKHQGNGLAIFISKDFFKTIRLPKEFDEKLLVSDRFLLRPLIGLLKEDRPFYVLALSQKHTSLYSGTLQKFEKLSVPDMPDGIDEALWHRDDERVLQHHAQGRQGETGRAVTAYFHGHGGGDDDAENQITEYLRQVDDAVSKRLNRAESPLILACVDQLVPMYRNVSSYKYVMDEHIKGSPDRVDTSKLHQQAIGLIQPRFDREREQALEVFMHLSANEPGRISDDLAEIRAAAHQGKVSTLMYEQGSAAWGKFDDNGQISEMHEQPEPLDEDIIDTAAIHTLLHDGDVIPMPSGKLPSKSPAAAVLRY